MIKFGEDERPYADENSSEISFTDPTKEQLKKAIPIFLKYNIVETDVNSVY